MAGRGARLRRREKRAGRELTQEQKRTTVRRLEARIAQITRDYVKVIPQLQRKIGLLQECREHAACRAAAEWRDADYICADCGRNAGPGSILCSKCQQEDQEVREQIEAQQYEDAMWEREDQARAEQREADEIEAEGLDDFREAVMNWATKVRPE